MSSILVSSVAAAVNASKCCGSIARVKNPYNMNYLTVLATFKVHHEACLSVKDEDDPKVPKSNDRDNDRKIIHWAPIFKCCLASSHGSRDPLSFSLRDDPEILDESVDPLLANYYYE